MDSDYLASGLLSNRQLTRLASRGGRNRSSTRLPVLGRQLRNGGLHQPPFLFSKPVFPPHQLFPENPRRVPSPGKSLLPDSFQGPSGGATARAWGWRVLQSEVSSGVPTVPLRSRAAGRRTGANRSQLLSYSRKP